MDEPISRRLAQDLSYLLITNLQQKCTRVLSRNESWGMALSLCCTWNWRCFWGLFPSHDCIHYGPYFSFFPWEALLHYRLYFTYRRQHDCLVKLATHISFKVWHNPPSSILKHYITYTFFSSKLQTPFAFHRHFSLARRLGRILVHTTSTIVKHLNKLRPDPLFSAVFVLVRAIRASPS